MSGRAVFTDAPVRVVDLGGQDPLVTQAVYHVLAERMSADKPDTVVLTWPTAPYVCLGYHQRLSQVLDLPAVRERALPVVRRRVGGGLTYLDEDQVFYQFVFHHGRAPAVPRALYAHLLAAPIGALGRLGVEARLERENEVEVGQRRIAGIGAGRIGEASVVVGNVLLDFDHAAMAAVWRRPSRAFGELAAAALADRLTTLRREGISASRRRVMDALREELSAALGRPVVSGRLTDEEEAALGPVGRRLTAPDFLEIDEVAGTTPAPLRLKISARAAVHEARLQLLGCDVTAALLVHDGVIAEARLESSPDRDWANVEARLRGEPLGHLLERVAALRESP